MEQTRKELVYKIMSEYINKYTCACMADRLADYKRGIAIANDDLFKKINEHHITMEEAKAAVTGIELEAERLGKACCYEVGLFSTLFFRN